jgi:hypothetical protein
VRRDEFLASVEDCHAGPKKIEYREGAHMPLNLIVENLDNVPAEQHAFYAEKGGKFHLDVVDLDAYFESRVVGLKSALVAERENNKLLKNLGRAPSEIAALIADAEMVSTRLANIDVVIKQHQDKHELEKSELLNQVKASHDSERSVIREAVLGAGLANARATPEGLSLLTERLGERVKLDTVEGKRVLTIMQADGETPMFGKDGKAATFGDLIEASKKEFPSLFEGSGAGGGGRSSRDGGSRLAVDKTINRAEWNQLNPHDQAAKMRDGWKLID